MTVWYGLQLCREKQWLNVLVEWDSELACSMILYRWKVPWKYKYLIRWICNLFGLGMSSRHIYRQANQVADGFANLAYGLTARMEFQALTEVPRNIQKLLFIDRIGLSVYRPNCI